MGDFIEILTHDEKEGGGITPEWRLWDFRKALVHNDLTDYGLKPHTPDLYELGEVTVANLL